MQILTKPFYSTVYMMLLATLLTGSVSAGDEAEAGSGTKGDRPGREEMRAKILNEFDDDGDGRLNENERANAREEMQGRRGRGGGQRGPAARGPRDRDGEGRGPNARRRGPGNDGPPGEGPRRRGPEGRRGFQERGGPEGRSGRGQHVPPDPEHVFNRFDENEDGQLSRQEFMRLSHAMREMRERGGPPRQEFGRQGPRGERGPGSERGLRGGDDKGPRGARGFRGEGDGDRRPEHPRRQRPDFEGSSTELEADANT
ncbi:MAG: hypothetical protein CMJ72_01720 [Planctomycetaceae bacterium]|nr:hypothetical protein [Planctomycetaceae bacterium]